MYVLPLRITPIGGIGEIGNNCFLYESDNQSLVVDCGMDMSEDLTRDEIIARFSELQDKNVKAILLTHAHLDHAAVGMFLAQRLNVPLFVSEVGKQVIKNYRRFIDYLLPMPKIITFKMQEEFTIGSANITPVEMPHSIPQSVGFLIQWNNKTIFHLGDCKLTGYEAKSRQTSIVKLKWVGAQNVDLLVMDILNIRYPGFTPPESEAVETLLSLIESAPNKKHYSFLFASNLKRIGALWYNLWRKARIRFMGRSMENSSRILEFLTNKKVLTYSALLPTDTAMYFCTGCQGEQGSFIERLAFLDKLSAKDMVKPGDHVYISSTLIPSSNPELEIRKKAHFRHLLKRLQSQGAKIFVHTGQKHLYGNFVTEANIHVSGHECYNGLCTIVEMVKPKLLMPYHAPQNLKYIKKVEHLIQEVNTRITQPVLPITAANGITFTV